HAGAYVVTFDDRRVADAHALHVRDRVQGAGLVVAQLDSQVTRPQLWITSSTSSRLRSISSGERASRFRRRSGSVVDGGTFRCQSFASTEMPSRWLTRPSLPKRSLISCSFSAMSGTGVLISPVRK